METPLPSSSSEVISLVLALYEPSPPHVISQIQGVLHRVQKSPSAWLIARDLLEHEDDKVKFFGALTIIIKLNTESNTLGANDVRELLDNLFGWLNKSLTDGSGTIVVRKLTSALVTLFLHFSDHWQQCIKGLAVALSPDRHHQSASSESPELKDVLLTLGGPGLRTLLWFSASLVEETGKADLNSNSHAGISANTLANASDATLLMYHCLTAVDGLGGSDALSLQEDCLRCFQSWVLFSQRVASRGDDIVEALRSLLEPAMQALYSDSLFEVAGEVFSDILSNYSGFLQDQHFQALFKLLQSPWAQAKYHQLVEGNFDFDLVLFGQIMLSLGDSCVQQLIEDVSDRSQLFLERLRGLAAARGFPVGEDKIFVPALEFWSTFVETLIDTMFSEETGKKSWAVSATFQVIETVAGVWRKASFPPSDEFASWDSADRAAFGDARKDIADFLQSAYTVAGPQLVSTFVELVLTQLEHRQWPELEAATFCLGSLADCVSGDNCDGPLKAVFTSHLFDVLQQSRDDMPSRVRQTCILLIERYAEYFERDPGSLPDALRLLFSVLSDASLAGAAARSIQRLCSSSRQILAPEARGFLEQYRTMSRQHQLECLASEKVCGAIASVIQAVPSDAERLNYIEQLLLLTREDFDESLRIFSGQQLAQRHACLTDTDMPNLPEHLALKTLRCLVSIGKGLQTPVEGPLGQEGHHVVTYATESGRLTAVQEEILTMLNTVQVTFPQSSEVVECICTVFRTGFSETDPGPFVFPPIVVSQYLTSQTAQGPRIGLFVSTACSFVSSMGKLASPEADNLRKELLVWAIRLCTGLPEPDHDTEMSQNCIEFVTRLISRKPGILLQGEGAAFAEAFFNFTLTVLEGREPLPKAAAADFWATFFSLKAPDEGLQSTIDVASKHLGPILARSLIRNVGGNAARSELDKLCEPLKRLVSHHAGSRAWLEESLFDPTFPGHHLSHEERGIFLKRVISLRGSRATNQVVRDFWLAARGSKFAYAS